MFSMFHFFYFFLENMIICSLRDKIFNGIDVSGLHITVKYEKCIIIQCCIWVGRFNRHVFDSVRSCWCDCVQLGE